MRAVKAIASLCICVLMLFFVSGDKWQSKAVSNFFDLRSSIVITFSIATSPV